MGLSARLASFFFTVLFLSVLQAATLDEAELDLDRPLISSALIDSINSDPEAGWVAGVNEKFVNFTLRDFKSMGGAALEPHMIRMKQSSKAELEELKSILKQVPSFDARYNWYCPSMWRILDQGTCGACWAFASVQVLQDRFCIEHNLDVQLSPNNVLTCCTTCGNCDMGYIDRAYEYLRTSGALSWGCSPYFDTTACPNHGCKGVDTPACVRGCQDGTDFNRRFYGTNKYVLKTVPDIMREIMNNGPVSAWMKAFQDLSVYRGGVYRHRSGNFIINHFVKLVGWGSTSQGEAYWIATNQWGKSWGEEGHFRIALGINECNIEALVEGVHAVAPTYLKSVV